MTAAARPRPPPQDMRRDGEAAFADLDLASALREGTPVGDHEPR